MRGFWEDRYHATAVESGSHLRQCPAYIDLNMVRAGVVKNPGQWWECGFVEIQHPKARYGIINFERLMELMQVDGMEGLQQACRQQVETLITQKTLERQSHWSESLAIGSPEYVEEIKKQLETKAKGRDLLSTASGSLLRESPAAYPGHFEGKKGRLSPENSRFLDLSIHYS
jgi:putative transposase